MKDTYIDFYIEFETVIIWILILIEITFYFDIKTVISAAGMAFQARVCDSFV